VIVSLLKIFYAGPNKKGDVMRRVVLLLILTKSLFAHEPIRYYHACRATQEYVENLARYMGIKGRIEVLINPDGTWSAAPAEGYVLIPAQAENVLSKRRLRLKSSAALQRGLLMHELGHLRQQLQRQQGVMSGLYVACNASEQLRLSREKEKAADAAVLNDRDVLIAMRDFFVERSGVASLYELEKVTEKELLSQTSAKSTHPSDAARALYFHQRLRLLEQNKQEDSGEYLRMLLMNDFC
jgi:hypothetical protein